MKEEIGINKSLDQEFTHDDTPIIESIEANNTTVENDDLGAVPPSEDA